MADDEKPRLVRYDVPVIPEENAPLYRSQGDQLFTRSYRSGDTVILPLMPLDRLIKESDFDPPTLRGHDELMHTVMNLYDVTSEEKVLGLPLNAVIEFLTKSNMTMKGEYIKQLAALPYEDLVAGISATPMHESVYKSDPKKQLADFFYQVQMKEPKQYLVPGKQSMIEFPPGFPLGPLDEAVKKGPMIQAPEIITQAPIAGSEYEVMLGNPSPSPRELEAGQYWTSELPYAHQYLEGERKPGLMLATPSAEEWKRIRSPQLVKSLRDFSTSLFDKGIKGKLH